MRARGVLALALAASLAAAPAVSAFPSHAGGRGLLDVRSAEVPVAGSFDVQFSGLAYRTEESNGLDQRPVDVVDGGLQVAWGWGGRAEIWGRFDAAFLSIEEESYSAFSNRDGRLGAKVRLPGPRWLVPGLMAEASLPVGNRPRGFSTDSVDPALTALLTFPLPDSNTLTGAALHVNAGWRRQGDERGRGFEGWPLYYLEPVHPAADGDRVDLRAALELSSQRTTLFAEVLLDQLLADDLSFSESPLFLAPGFRFTLGDGSYSLLVASKIALSTDDVETARYKPPELVYPDWQVGFALSWSRQGPAADRDGDGVPDFRDRCPREAEDRDGFEDDDGCPDPDNDGDGIPDAFDAAPDDPEDFDGWLDTDGAPDPDNDGDGVPDAEDACPDLAEDRDGVQDGDGCPEDDADGDGIPDGVDACPEEAETVDGVDDEDGCPDRVGGTGDPYLLRGVLWEGMAVAPTPASYLELNRLAERMRRESGLAIEVRVHAPADGDSGRMTLAELRAEYVKAFLVAAGVEPHRVLATGATGGTIHDTPFEGALPPEDATRVEVVPIPRGSLVNDED